MSIPPSPDQDLAAIRHHIEDRQWQLTVNTSVKKVHFWKNPVNQGFIGSVTSL